MKQQLAQWLHSEKRDYKAGVKIFRGLKIDANKHAFFAQGEFTYTRNILEEELKRYARVNNVKLNPTPAPNPIVPTVDAPIQPSAPVTIPPKASAPIPPKANVHVDESKNTAGENVRTIIKRNPHINYDDLSDELKVKYDANMKRQAEFNKLNAAIRAIPEGEEYNEQRAELVKQIEPISDLLIATWTEIDATIKGKTPAPADVITKASGGYSLEEIETIADPEIKALSKQKRIDANKNYLARYGKETSEKKMTNCAERLAELKTWGIEYATKPDDSQGAE